MDKIKYREVTPKNKEALNKWMFDNWHKEDVQSLIKATIQEYRLEGDLVDMITGYLSGTNELNEFYDWIKTIKENDADN
jgi:hypothetical protein